MASINDPHEQQLRGAAQAGIAREIIADEAALHSERADTHAGASSSGRRAEWLASAALEAIVQEDSQWYPWRYGSRIHYRHANPDGLHCMLHGSRACDAE